MTLSEQVNQYQIAVAANDQEAKSQLYEAILKQCAGVEGRVASRITDPSLSLEDISGSVFDRCLQKPDAARNFLAYYQRALTNGVLSEYRKRKMIEWSDNYDKQATVSEEAKEAELNEALSVYRDRKRKLLDTLLPLLKPIAQYSTLLIDQRQRIVSLQRTLNHLPISKPFATAESWIEHFESWRPEDSRRPLATGESTVGEIWDFFSKSLHGQEEASRDDVVEAIVEAGTSINGATWRKRISRYLASVRDQVDGQEWLLFHASN